MTARYCRMQIRHVCNLRMAQVGKCGLVHGVELHASNVAFARDAIQKCVCVAMHCVMILFAQTLFSVEY